MDRDKILSLLEEKNGAFVSGEEMSRSLGVTRAAVWKQIALLRDKGYVIESRSRMGYRLLEKPEELRAEHILSALGDHPWADRLHVFDSIDSTNNALKRDAEGPLPEGTIYIADEQTGGRGRQGRSFASPKGVGIYFSVLLRPDCPPQSLGHVTAMAAVACCDAIEETCGVRPGIKWTNDIILGDKKIVGILTEMHVEWESGTVRYVVIGAGFNCNHTMEDFPEAVWDMAGSIRGLTGRRVDRSALSAALIRRMYTLSREIVSGKEEWLRRYRQDCITLEREVRVIRGSDSRTGKALGIDENGGLIVKYDSGETGVVYSGEVSVRGLYGYV